MSTIANEAAVLLYEHGGELHYTFITKQLIMEGKSGLLTRYKNSRYPDITVNSVLRSYKYYFCQSHRGTGYFSLSTQGAESVFNRRVGYLRCCSPADPRAIERISADVVKYCHREARAKARSWKKWAIDRGGIYVKHYRELLLIVSEYVLERERRKAKGYSRRIPVIAPVSQLVMSPT